MYRFIIYFKSPCKCRIQENKPFRLTVVRIHIQSFIFHINHSWFNCQHTLDSKNEPRAATRHCC